MSLAEVLDQYVRPALVTILTVLGAYGVARLSKRATDRQTAAGEKKDAGALALEIARTSDRRSRRTQREVDALHDWRRGVVDDWLPVHEQRDRAMEEDLRRLDPSVEIPPAVRMPRYVPPPDDDDSDTA